MAVTRLKRKALRNKLRAKKRISKLKHLLFKPVVKNIENLNKETNGIAIGNADSSGAINQVDEKNNNSEEIDKKKATLKF